MIKNRYFNNRKSIALQIKSLKKAYDKDTYSYIWKRNKLIWRQIVQPDINYPKQYEITVEYDGMNPKVFLFNQGIKKSKEDIVEHTFTSDFIDTNHEYVQLCLFYPEYHEWDNTMLLSDTIIPWAVEWLYYYENWRITGKWLGDEIKHGTC